MFTIKNEVVSELDISKSRFVTLIYKLNSIDDVKKYLDVAKEKYPAATHYCYAYIFNSSQKVSDDGEPSGTAGMPILNVLIKKDLEHVLCVVVRYFGGIKLGAGGLVRAYSNSCVDALDKTEIVEMVPGKIVRIYVDYNSVNNLNYILRNNKILYKEFNDNVIYEVMLHDEEIENIKMYKYEIIDDCLLEKEKEEH